ncbi:MAG: aminotransferase class V-fold PLP-dependent enzyme [Clostridia bacterium]|nr:aminotransferase class V-fold PLP-dependent enzyme [Clostridia bacterium]
MIYLDNAATTLEKPGVVYKTYFDAVRRYSANAGRGGHRMAMRASEMVSDAAEAVAELFKIDAPERIAFTCNTTLALNLAIHGLLKAGDHVVITGMEHNSVLRPVVHSGCAYSVAAADGFGCIAPAAVANAMRKNTRLVIVNHISNVCGQIQDIDAISKVVHARGAFLLVDAAQSAGVTAIDVVRQRIDMLAFAGHKGLMGPLGTGGLYVGAHVELSPLLQGGSGSESENVYQPSTMPDLLVSGTVNAPAIAALGSAVRYVQALGESALLSHERALADAFCARLREIPQVKLYRSETGGSGVVSLNIAHKNPVEVSSELDTKFGIAVRSGLHCAPLAHKSLSTYPAGTVRFSFGYFNTMRDVEKATDAIYKICKA